MFYTELERFFDLDNIGGTDDRTWRSFESGRLIEDGRRSRRPPGVPFGRALGRRRGRMDHPVARILHIATGRRPFRTEA